MYFVLFCVLMSCAIYFGNVSAASVSAQDSPKDGSCLMPNNPPNGEYTIGNTTVGTFKPGSYVSSYSSLRVLCNPGHEAPPPGKAFSVCNEGEWSSEPAKCVRTPVCGNKRPRGKPNIIGGQIAEIGEIGDYPWRVGIHGAESKNYICEGSLLNERVILSAAHCFTDISTGSKYPKDNYLIAAGNYHRAYDDPRDQFVQHAAIEDIHIPTRYKGDVSQYEGDIALLVLKTKLELSIAVQPVCVDWYNAFEYQQLSGNNHGVVVGFGGPGEEPSEVLKELNFPVIPYDRCYEQVPKPFRKFVTHDKVCAGFLGNATAGCHGVSGAGLAFPDSEERYYIRGILSTAPLTPERTCDSNQYSTYTLVSKYIDFIKLHVP